MQKMNEDGAPRDHAKLKDVKATIVDDPDYQDLSEECQKELLDQLMALRMKKFSIHINNKAVAMDTHSSIGRIQQEGNVGHLDDLSIPECVEVDGSLDFCSESLNMNVRDVICLFDKFVTTQGLEALRVLWDVLWCGACHWTMMSNHDIQEMDAKVKKQRENDDGEGGRENDCLAKQKKVTKSKPKNKGKAGKGKAKEKVTDMLPPKSKEFVDDSDSHSNDGEPEDTGDKGSENRGIYVICTYAANAMDKSHNKEEYSQI
ncbi:hypothetical protein ARMGADRAFT_1025553 [Armillaria gallica]|uniref:Uncharacterized protein n=1 Tax=Armillaria gallica TaxID=47427 RepID=A0A2H3DVS6_ARMGA|nr:hypothetical protein ARMGADRAFT_1025553 [Armillaria gallica]